MPPTFGTVDVLHEHTASCLFLTSTLFPPHICLAYMQVHMSLVTNTHLMVLLVRRRCSSASVQRRRRDHDLSFGPSPASDGSAAAHQRGCLLLLGSQEDTSECAMRRIAWLIILPAPPARPRAPPPHPYSSSRLRRRRSYPANGKHFSSIEGSHSAKLGAK